MALWLDHLVYAAPDLEGAMTKIGGDFGVMPVIGGAHPGFGTRNALLRLGADAYLEIIAPDPAQSQFQNPRPFGLDDIKQETLVSWALRTDSLEAHMGKAGFHTDDIRAMERRTPTGQRLSWRMVVSRHMAAEPLLPFLIDWQNSRHPALDAPGGCSLVSLRFSHPRSGHLTAALQDLSLDFAVEEGPRMGMCALIQTPLGLKQIF